MMTCEAESSNAAGCGADHITPGLLVMETWYAVTHTRTIGPCGPGWNLTFFDFDIGLI